MQSKIKELNKSSYEKKITGKENEMILDYVVGEFEMVGRLKIADQSRETHIRFRNIDHFECPLLTLLIKIMNLNIQFSMVMFTKSKLLNLTQLLEVNM